jgi:peptidoglycan DL-endopeptidase CwlO
MRMLKTAIVVVGLLAMGVSSRAQDDGDVTPSPSPAHHRRLHKAALDDGDTPSPTPTSTPHHKKKRIADDEDATPAPSESPAEKTPVEKSAAEKSETDDTPSPTPHNNYAADAFINPDDLQEYAHLDTSTQTLIQSALALTRQNLTYTYSSADPANGGMDCSGFIYYILTQAGAKEVPRDSAEQYEWVWKSGKFRAVNSRGLDGFETADLHPGDLLFWTGTYSTDRDPPVTHTMLYLGREKSTGNRVMVGSSDGRSYHGIQRWGVSVFDLKAQPVRSGTSAYAGSRFIGYGPIPGLNADQ